MITGPFEIDTTNDAAVARKLSPKGFEKYMEAKTYAREYAFNLIVKLFIGLITLCKSFVKRFKAVKRNRME